MKAIAGKHKGDSDMIAIEGLCKTYAGKLRSLPVLTEINLAVEPGQFCALTGPSGSGKSTLLNLIGLLDRPDRGSIVLNGMNTGSLSDRETASLRNKLIGFVFQSFHLLPHLSIVDNVGLPLS